MEECETVVIDGEPVRLRRTAGKAMSEETMAALTEIVRTARRMMASEEVA